jgi:hypothetical protein
VLQAKPEVGPSDVSPTYVSHEGSNWTFPAPPVPTAAKASPVPVSLEITQVPTRAFRAYPVIGAEDKVVDARFSPAVGTATWEVAIAGSPMVSKVKLTLSDQAGGSVVEEELGPDALRWPTDLTGQHELTLPLNNPIVLKFLSSAPSATAMNVVVQLVDAEGKPLAGKNGKPFQLQLPVDVM